MNRRGFLSALGAFAATAVLDPEFLLWKPGAKTIFIPHVFTLPQDELLHLQAAYYNQVALDQLKKMFVFMDDGIPSRTGKTVEMFRQSAFYGGIR